jgi:hypothetical protein
MPNREIDVEKLLDTLCAVARVADLACSLRGKSPGPDRELTDEVRREITEHVRARWLEAHQ